VYKIWTKNSQPFRKKCQKTIGVIFFDSHCTYGIFWTRKRVPMAANVVVVVVVVVVGVLVVIRFSIS